MKNNNRLYYLLTAGTLTALLFATVLLFGGNFLGAVADAATNDGNGATILNRASISGLGLGNDQTDNAQKLSVTQTNPTADAKLTTLQAQNAKLIQMVQTMQERERQYQAQLQAANQALQTSPVAPSTGRYEEYEHNEHERAEHGEHEGFGEHD